MWGMGKPSSSPAAIAAYMAVAGAIRTGELVRPDACADCGMSAREATEADAERVRGLGESYWVPADRAQPGYIVTGWGPPRPRTYSLNAHHADYSRPLDVEWLCIGCHSRRHRGVAARARWEKPA